MKPFLVTVPVTSVHGHQVFRVQANSADEAYEKFENGGESEFVCEEVEVVSLGRPEYIEEEGAQ